MGFLDKLKNVFFEEEEVDDNTKELAKKVEIPKINNKDVIKPKAEIKESNITDENNAMEEEEIVPPINNNSNSNSNTSKFPMLFEDEDFLDDTSVSMESKSSKPNVENYQTKKIDTYVSQTSTPYNYTKTTVTKESKTFKPSPIISPIYGILDKNYTKEEVVTKKEIRISSNKKANLDEARSKILGDKSPINEDSHEVKKEEKKDVKKGKDFYDVNTSKPSVDNVTLADADEYYSELGLAYNVDYNDKSRTAKRKDKKENEKEGTLEDNLFDLIESMYDKEE